MRDSRAYYFSSPLPPERTKEVRKTRRHQEEKYAKNFCFQGLGLDNGRRVGAGWIGGALNNRVMIGWGRGCQDRLCIDQLIDWWSQEKALVPGDDRQSSLSLTSNLVTGPYIQSCCRFVHFYQRAVKGDQCPASYQWTVHTLLPGAAIVKSGSGGRTKWENKKNWKR